MDTYNMKIKVLAHLDRYKDQLTDVQKVACFLLSQLHRKYRSTDLFLFHFYDSKIIMGYPIFSVHPPKEVGPIKVGNYGDRIAIGLKWAQYNLDDQIEWNVTDESAIALYTYYKTLFNTDFDFEGEFYGLASKKFRRFTYKEMNETFNLR